MGNEASITCCSGPGREGLNRYEENVRRQTMPIAGVDDFKSERINEWSQLGDMPSDKDPWWCGESAGCVVGDGPGDGVTRVPPKGGAYLVADSPEGALMSTEMGDGVGAMWMSPEELLPVAAHFSGRSARSPTTSASPRRSPAASRENP
mmetsp:Transcript_92707/g.235765  ORF Transcript_92707/g.235765 Transcript_92707/m.235765 type:complete len:149 (+) Transcript_92707:106-552(+)